MSSSHPQAKIPILLSKRGLRWHYFAHILLQTQLLNGSANANPNLPMTNGASFNILAYIQPLFLPENDRWCQFADSGQCLIPFLTREWQMMPGCRFWPIFKTSSYRRMTDDARLQILVYVQTLFLSENDRWCQITDSGFCSIPLLTREWQMVPDYRFWSTFNPSSYRRMTDDASLQILVFV